MSKKELSYCLVVFCFSISLDFFSSSFKSMAVECWIFTEVSFDCLLHMCLDNEFPLQYNKNNDLDNKQLSFERAHQRMKRIWRKWRMNCQPIQFNTVLTFLYYESQTHFKVNKEFSFSQSWERSFDVYEQRETQFSFRLLMACCLSFVWLVFPIWENF